MNFQNNPENLQKILALFQTYGYDSRIEGSFVKVQEKHSFSGFGKTYQIEKEIRINKLKNAELFLKARV